MVKFHDSSTSFLKSKNTCFLLEKNIKLSIIFIYDTIELVGNYGTIFL